MSHPELTPLQLRVLDLLHETYGTLAKEVTAAIGQDARPTLDELHSLRAVKLTPTWYYTRATPSPDPLSTIVGARKAASKARYDVKKKATRVSRKAAKDSLDAEQLKSSLAIVMDGWVRPCEPVARYTKAQALKDRWKALNDRIALLRAKTDGDHYVQK